MTSVINDIGPKLTIILQEELKEVLPVHYNHVLDTYCKQFVREVVTYATTLDGGSDLVGHDRFAEALLTQLHVSANEVIALIQNLNRKIGARLITLPLETHQQLVVSRKISHQFVMLHMRLIHLDKKVH